MRLNILDVIDVAERQLCCGCGACAYAEPQSIEIIDVLEHGRRPRLRQGAPTAAAARAMSVCPGIGLSHRTRDRGEGLIESLLPGWGPVLEVWEGHASDDAVRFAGSSGGAGTALALYCIEQGGMHGALHIAARPDIPYLNRTVLSRTRAEVLGASGSRYAPASPCDGLQMVEDAPGPCVFIGKPCDVAGANKAAAGRPALTKKLGLTIGIFCAGTPSTLGTLEMIRGMGVENLADVTNVRYRGNGWPGNAVVTTRSGGRGEMTYQQSWGDILSRHTQWRCRVCPDHTGEFADLAVGDPWYRPVKSGEPGRSLIVVRSTRGQAVLRAAMAAGYVVAERVDPMTLPKSQPNLLRVRGHVWMRTLICKILGAAAPKYSGIPTARFWFTELSLRDKAQSVVGTIRRVWRRGLRERAQLSSFEPQKFQDAPPAPTASR